MTWQAMTGQTPDRPAVRIEVDANDPCVVFAKLQSSEAVLRYVLQRQSTEEHTGRDRLADELGRMVGDPLSIQEVQSD